MKNLFDKLSLYLYGAWLVLKFIGFAFCLLVVGLTGFCVVACLWPFDVIIRLIKSGLNTTKLFAFRMVRTGAKLNLRSFLKGII